MHYFCNALLPHAGQVVLHLLYRLYPPCFVSIYYNYWNVACQSTNPKLIWICWQVNHKVVVPQNQALFPEDRCHFSVLDQEPLTQRFGAEKTNTLSCSFKKRQRKRKAKKAPNVHFGSQIAGTGQVRLQLRYDTQTDTIIVPIAFQIDATVVTFTLMHLADAFIQSDLQCIQAIHFFLSAISN